MGAHQIPQGNPSPNLEIVQGCPGDIWRVSLKLFMNFLERFVGFLDIFYGCP